MEPPPPLFLDSNGQLMNFDAPAPGVPEGELVQGVAVDFKEEGGGKGKDKKKADDNDEEPQIHAAQAP